MHVSVGQDGMVQSVRRMNVHFSHPRVLLDVFIGGFDDDFGVSDCVFTQGCKDVSLMYLIFSTSLLSVM